MQKPPLPARLRSFARENRTQQSAAEGAVWSMVRGRRLGAKVRRQHPVPPFIADFACVEARLILEVDGLSHRTDEAAAYDERREAALSALGWRVLRLDERYVLADPSGAEQRIRTALAAALNGSPLPPGEGRG
jgi:very-short-patch-repair endonuclease